MIHELRIYHAMPGRLADISRRFKDITLKLFEKHGIRQVGFWTVAIGESNNDLYYILEWDSMAEREKRWASFAADPEWQKARAETEKDGPLISHFSNSILTPTSYSKLK